MPRKRPLEAREPEEDASKEEGDVLNEPEDEPPKKSAATLSVEIEEPELNAIGGASLLADPTAASDARPNRPLKAVPQWMQAAHRIPADNTSPVEQLPLPQWLIANLLRMGLERCFPVQAEVIPKGTDLSFSLGRLLLCRRARRLSSNHITALKMTINAFGPDVSS